MKLDHVMFQGTPFAVYEGDVRVECFETKEEAQAYADKQNKEQGLGESKVIESADVLCEATVEIDAMDPDDKDFLKFLKKNKVEIIDKKMEGPGGSTPVITMQGKRKDLEAVLADKELGWDDADLAEYIEESKVNEDTINEKDVTDEKSFREYAESVLKKGTS